jgi:hypothetical protein
MAIFISAKFNSPNFARRFHMKFSRGSLLTLFAAQAVAIAMVFIGCKVAPTENQNDDVIQLLRLEEEWLNLEYSGEVNKLSTLLDTGYVSVTPTEILKKHQFLSQVGRNFEFRKLNGIHIDSFKIERPLVKVFENAAVVTFIEHYYAHKSGKSLEGTEQFYDVWRNVNGKWLAVSSQKHY